jgi:hypothetical protein
MEWIRLHCRKFINLILHFIFVGVVQLTNVYKLHTERLERLTKQFNAQAGEGMADLYIAVVQLTLTRSFGLYTYFIHVQAHSSRCFHFLIEGVGPVTNLMTVQKSASFALCFHLWQSCERCNSSSTSGSAEIAWRRHQACV